MCIVGVLVLVIHSTHATHCWSRCLFLGDLYNYGFRGGHQGRHTARWEGKLVNTSVKNRHQYLKNLVMKTR